MFVGRTFKSMKVNNTYYWITAPDSINYLYSLEFLLITLSNQSQRHGCLHQRHHTLTLSDVRLENPRTVTKDIRVDNSISTLRPQYTFQELNLVLVSSCHLRFSKVNVA